MSTEAHPALRPGRSKPRFERRGLSPAFPGFSGLFRPSESPEMPVFYHAAAENPARRPRWLSIFSINDVKEQRGRAAKRSRHRGPEESGPMRTKEHLVNNVKRDFSPSARSGIDRGGASGKVRRKRSGSATA
jgi:hypothetical protein